MLKPRKELEEAMLPFLEKYRYDKNFIRIISKDLLNKNNVITGDVKSFFSRSEKTLKESDTRLLFLILEFLYGKSNDVSIDPDEFFTEEEQRYARRYDGKVFIKEKIKLPYTFPNVIYVNGNYLLKISAEVIKKFMDSLILNYNFETQREHTEIIRGGKVRKTPTVNQKNIDEMVDHLRKGTLKESMMIWNAAIGSAIGNDELYYNADKMELTIHRGTVLDILDGYHRCRAVQIALSIDPTIEVDFPLFITNVMTSQAQEHVRQIAQAMPMSENRKQSLDKDLKANIIIDELKLRSELKDRIAIGNQTSSLRGELVSYNILAESIEREFKIKRKSDAIEISNYLCNFFDYLIDKYYDVFIENRNRKDNLMAENVMFAGYIILARRLHDENLSINIVSEIIDDIDFSRDNKMWRDIKVLDENNHLTAGRSKKYIEVFFRELDLEKYKDNGVVLL